MCTKQEVTDVLNNEFFKKDGLRDRLLVAFKKDLDAELGKYVRRQVIAFVILLATVMAAWFSLENQVSKNTDELAKGDRFTSQEGDFLQFQITQLNSSVEEDLQELKELVKSLDARLRAQGI